MQVPKDPSKCSLLELPIFIISICRYRSMAKIVDEIEIVIESIQCLSSSIYSIGKLFQKGSKRGQRAI